MSQIAANITHSTLDLVITLFFGIYTVIHRQAKGFSSQLLNTNRMISSFPPKDVQHHHPAKNPATSFSFSACRWYGMLLSAKMWRIRFRGQYFQQQTLLKLRLESCANDGSEEMDCEMKAHNSYTTGGGFKYCILYFHPNFWGNDPI